MKLGTVDWLKTSCYLPDAFNPDRSGNWAEPDYLACYTDGAGSIAVVTKRYTGDTLAIDTFNPRTLRRIGSRRSISLAGWPCWGGFYAGADGCFYVLVGRENPNENDDREVVAVRRYDRNWTLLGTAYIQGSSDLTGGGIYSPFVGGAPHMVLVGERLVVHMGRLILSLIHI